MTAVLMTLLASRSVAQTNADPARVPSSEIILKPGDVLKIQIWPDQALSGEFVIEETGIVYLPVIGRVQAGGVSLDSLRAQLRQQYGEVLKQPVVMVIPLFPVYVIGAVTQPGVYQVSATATVFDVVGRAGGFGPRARSDRVKLIRDGVATELDLRGLVESGSSLAPLRVRSGDRIVVPTRGSSILTFQNAYYVLQTAIWAVTLRELLRR